MNDEHRTERLPGAPGLGGGRLVFVVFASVAVFFLLTEHRAHLFGVLPYLLVLACPLMHLFHGGHGRHGARGGAATGGRNGGRP